MLSDEHGWSLPDGGLVVSESGLDGLGFSIFLGVTISGAWSSSGNLEGFVHEDVWNVCLEAVSVMDTVDNGGLNHVLEV